MQYIVANSFYLTILALFTIFIGGTACVAHNAPTPSSNAVLDTLQGIHAESAPRALVEVVHSEVEIEFVNPSQWTITQGGSQ